MSPLRFIVPPSLAAVADAASRVHAAMWDGAESPRVHAALSEALLNAILYGALEIAPSVERRDPVELEERIAAAERSVGADRAVVVEVEPATDALPEAVVRVRDPGRGFDWRAVHARLARPGDDALLRESGRGLLIIHAAASSVVWNESGTEITLKFRAPPRPGRRDSEPPGTTRILVVDDDKSQRDLYRLQLAAAGYVVDVAPDGATALGRMAESPPDLALVDVQMPGLSGIDVVTRMSDMKLLDRTSVLLMTAGGANDDLRCSGLEAGAVDFLARPIGRRELVARIERTLAQTHRIARLEGERASLQDSVTSARKIVEALLPPPETRFATASVSSLVSPCSAVGGDIVDVFRTSATEWGALLVDVAGHGVAAALSATTSRAVLRGHMTSDGGDLRRGVIALNARMCEDIEATSHHAAVALIRVDERTRVIEALNAGCPPILFFMRDGALRKVRSAAPPAGLLADAAFHVETFLLDAVAEIVVLSDGITEGFATSADSFGALTALTAAASRGGATTFRRESVDAAIASLGPERDDASILWIRFASPSPAETRGRA